MKKPLYFLARAKSKAKICYSRYRNSSATRIRLVKSIFESAQGDIQCHAERSRSMIFN